MGDAGRFSSLSGPGTAGGAGGQVIELEIPSPSIGSYQIAVGLGGNPTPYRLSGPTRFGSLLTASGGGSASLGYSPNEANGLYAASIGFNSSGKVQSFWPNIPTTGGFPGGNAWSNYSNACGGGGGGGAGGPGGDATISGPGLGGVGVISSITGTPVEYGRGGNGGHTSVTLATPAFGPGGGGGAVRPTTQLPQEGLPGNPGILVFRYLTGTQSWTGGDVSQVGPWTVHTFTADGTATRLS